MIEPASLAPAPGNLASAVHAVESDSAAGVAEPPDAADAPGETGEHGDASPDVGPTASEGTALRPTLLQAITREFDDEIARAETDETVRIRRLCDRLHPDRRPQPGVTAFVAFALLAASLLGIGAVLTLTDLREYVTPDRLSEATRIRAFGLSALIASLPPILRFTPSRSYGAQVWLTLVAALYAVLGAGIIVLAPQLAGSFLSRAGRWMPAVLVVGAVLALAVISWIRGARDDRALLGRVAPLTSDLLAGSVPVVYLFAMSVAALNFDRLAPPIFVDQDGRLLTVLLATAGVVAFVCGCLVRIVRRRDRHQVRGWKDRINELVDQCEMASARTAMLTMLKAHWLVTAAVIARLVHRPFGDRSDGSAAATVAPHVRKLLMFDLALSARTREAFLGEMLPLLAPRGWLREQHRRMSEQFAEAERRRLGITEQHGIAPPEHCAYPMSLESVRQASAQGSRWRFAERCYDGEFDALLGETLDDAVTKAMRATFMDERATVSMASLNVGAQSLPSLLGELLPTGDKRLPPGTLPPSREGQPEYDSHLWWPDGVALPDDVEPTELRCDHLRDGGSVIFHALRVDVSEPLALERLNPPPSASRADAGVADSSAMPPSGRRDPTPEPLM